MARLGDAVYFAWTRFVKPSRVGRALAETAELAIEKVHFGLALPSFERQDYEINR
jgi:hypothetical protein